MKKIIFIFILLALSFWFGMLWKDLQYKNACSDLNVDGRKGEYIVCMSKEVLGNIFGVPDNNEEEVTKMNNEKKD